MQIDSAYFFWMVKSTLIEVAAKTGIHCIRIKQYIRRNENNQMQNMVKPRCNVVFGIVRIEKLEFVFPGNIVNHQMEWSIYQAKY